MRGPAMQTVSCACGKKFGIKEEWAGRQVKCPACGNVFLVPYSSSPNVITVYDPAPAPATFVPAEKGRPVWRKMALAAAPLAVVLVLPIAYLAVRPVPPRRPK